MNHLFNVVLFAPDIPGNTGTIGRTCLALNAQLILIKPYGFDLSEKSVRRAGLDYWKFIKIKEYENWDDFLQNEKPQVDSMFFLSTKSSKIYYDAPYKEKCYIIFGSETAGLPQHIHTSYPDNFYIMPMFSEHVRSLNLANSACAVAYEALRQIKYQN